MFCCIVTTDIIHGLQMKIMQNIYIIMVVLSKVKVQTELQVTNLYMVLLPVLISITLGIHHVVGLEVSRRRKVVLGFYGIKSPNQLPHACVKITSKRNKSFALPSLCKAIILLDQIIEVFQGILLYLHSTKLLEDVKKRKIFMLMVHERSAHYLCYYFAGYVMSIVLDVLCQQL